MGTKKKVVRNKAERHESVLLERMEKKIDHVLESHTALHKEIDDFRNEMKNEMKDFRFEMRTEMGFLKADTHSLKSDTHSLKSDTHSLKEDSEMIKEYLSRIDDEIQDLKKSFVGKPEMKRLEHLETRLAHVELVVKKYYDKNSD